MTETYSYRVQPVYEIWKEYKPYIYRQFRYLNIDPSIWDDYYNECYLFMLISSRSYKEGKGCSLAQWCFISLAKKIKEWSFRWRYLIKRPRWLMEKKDQITFDIRYQSDLDRDGENRFDNIAIYNDSFVNKKIAKDIYNDLINKALDYLDKTTKDIILKYYGIDCEKQTLLQIASQYNKNPQAIASRINKAKKELKGYFERHFNINENNIGDILDYDA